MKNYAIFMCVFLLAACGKSDKADVRSSDRNRDLPSGPLYKTVVELLSDQWIERCDRVADPMMREMAQVLDSKVDEINKFMETLPASKTFKMVPFGSSQLKTYVHAPEVSNEWRTDHETWTGVYALYEKIKDQPMSRNWVQLNSSVRSMLTNDRKRIYFGQNLDLHHDAEQKIIVLKEKVDACVTEASCIVPSYSREDETFINSVGFYSYYKDEIETNKKRETLLKFQQRLKNDYDYIGFESNATIRVVKGEGISHLVIPFDGSEFSTEQKKQLQGYMESVWKSSDLDLQIEWKDAVKDIYKILFDLQSPGTRSYVTQSKKEMQLFPFTSDKAIAHETGHAIGFSDHYFPTWDSYSCVYATESNDSDIMSDVTGWVTSAEWNELNKNYLK